MKLILVLLSGVVFYITSNNPNSFRTEQMRFTRVREAYAVKEKTVEKTLRGYSIKTDSLRIYLRAFKTEKKLELWAKKTNDTAYTFVKVFPICEISGTIGPKRRVKDLQVPEGFYHLSGLNPYSKFYLSMQINYPNASDSIRGLHGHWGNYIFIHGGCVSSGCLAMTDDLIKELFVYCIEAYNSGQSKIEITIFPMQMSDSNYSKLMVNYQSNKDKTRLWTDLKRGYDVFNKTKVPPVIGFLPSGDHQVESNIGVKD